jgi:hypothetical protein
LRRSAARARFRRCPAALISFGLALLGLALVLPGPALPQTDETDWPTADQMRPKPSMDTTPVTVQMLSVTYRIPRNYLVFMSPMIPALRVTFPGLQPLTEETRKCFGSIAQSQQMGCIWIDFHLFGHGLTPAEMFESYKKNSLNITTHQGPFGYTRYDTGPEEARVETYTLNRNDHFIFFYCMISDYH